MHRIIVTLVAITAVASLTWGGQAIDELVTMSPNGTVEISNISGTVNVEAWSRDEVKVTGTLGDGAEGIEVDTDGDRVEVEVKYPDHQRHHMDVRPTHLEVMVPATCRLEVSTVSADITVSGVTGSQELESVSGRIDSRGDSSTVDIESVSGKITVDSARGTSELETVSGDIIVKNVDGSLDVESVSGSIEVLAGRLSRFDAESVSGSIRVKAIPAPDASYRIEAHSGAVVLAIPAGLGADFDISTFSGSIDNRIGPSATRTNQYGPGKRLNFSNAGGGARIRVDSFSGSVTLEEH